MPPAIRSIRDLQEAIRGRRKEQGPGQWIEGWGYDEQAFAEQRSPCRYDLDQSCSDAPVSLMRTCAHIRCVNSMALRIAGIDRNTPDPPGERSSGMKQESPPAFSKKTPGIFWLPFFPPSRKNSRYRTFWSWAPF